MNNQALKTSVSLFQEDRNIVGTLANRKGLNFSSALRQIIREWQELKSEQRVMITEAGKLALHDEETEPEP